jgi:NAD(P)H-quinone oxidoreductase subunit 5
MHAGVVNAGGYLMIRISPVISLSPFALLTLVVIGAFTACYGAIVMMTQTSVKKKLAYSTIAQMGFMLMQCGLGAFSAAMLHILAHSLYKAHAFLSSGSVLNQRAAIAGAAKAAYALKWTTVLSINLVAMSFVWVCFRLVGINLLQKPGGVLLSLILCMSIAYWVSRALATMDSRAIRIVIPTAAALMILYVASCATVDWLLGSQGISSVSQAVTYVITGVTALAFAGMLWLNIQLQNRTDLQWLNRMQIHASNGFYVENWLRRWFGSLLTS